MLAHKNMLAMYDIVFDVMHSDDFKLTVIHNLLFDPTYKVDMQLKPNWFSNIMQYAQDNDIDTSMFTINTIVTAAFDEDIACVGIGHMLEIHKLVFDSAPLDNIKFILHAMHKLLYDDAYTFNVIPKANWFDDMMIYCADNEINVGLFNMNPVITTYYYSK
jgi:hypothetical protein